MLLIHKDNMWYVFLSPGLSLTQSTMGSYVSTGQFCISDWLSVMFMDCRRKTKHPEKTHTDIGITCITKTLDLYTRFKHRSSCSLATVVLTHRVTLHYFLQLGCHLGWSTKQHSEFWQIWSMPQIIIFFSTYLSLFSPDCYLLQFMNRWIMTYWYNYIYQGEQLL